MSDLDPRPESPEQVRQAAAAFRDDRVEKTYLALVRGAPDDEGVVNAPLLRVEARRGDRTKPKLVALLEVFDSVGVRAEPEFKHLGA